MKTFFVALKEQSELGDKAPEWFQVFPAGVVLIEDVEPALMDDVAAALIIGHFESLKHDMVVDYEHQTLTGEQAPAAGWIRELEWRGTDGLWALSDWTDKAADYIAKREYRYFSPVATIRESDRRIVELYNLALTNQPRMMNLQALVAKHQPKQGRKTMFEKLKKLLGLGSDADEAAALTAVETMKQENDELKAKKPVAVVACKSVLTALGASEDDDEETVVAKVDGLKKKNADGGKMATDFEALKKDHLALKKKLDLRDRDDRVTAAMKSGKITADQKAWAEGYAEKDPEGFDTFIAKAPVIVPMKDLENGPEDPAGDTPAKKFELLIAKEMKDDKELSYGDAMNLVAKKNPELAEEYLGQNRK